MKSLFSVLLLVVFTVVSAQVTIEQKLVVVQNSGVNGGAFRVAVMVKGTNLTAANTVGSATIDITFDNTKLSLPGTVPLMAAATRWPVGITGSAYGRSATNNTTFVRVLLTGGNVNGNFDGTPAGYDLLSTYDSLVTITFTILNNAAVADFNISLGSNQIGLFSSHNNEDFSGVINNQTLTAPINLTGESLPVELVSFNAIAKGRNVELTWNTATETNNAGYEVERKAEGTEWTKVGFVEGNWTTASEHSYSYTEKLDGINAYSYRLKQIDRDGNFSYSNQVEVSTSLTAADYALSANYPNPFNPTTKFTFAVQNNEQVAVKVFNSIGQEVATLFNGVAAANTLYEMNFNATSLASGTYFYMLRSNGRFEIKKMMLMK